MTQLLTSLYFSVSLTQNTHNKEILNLKLKMVGMKYSYCSRVCETAHRMTKHLSIYRMQREIAHCTILRRIQCKTNDFLIIPETEAMLLLAKQIEGIYYDKEEEGLYTNNIETIDPVGIAEYAKKVDGEQVNPESVRNTCTWSRSGIQSSQGGFKVIKFTNSKREQARKLVGDEEFMAYLPDIPVVLNDNDLPFKNNVEYAWAKFMQESKITKGSIGIFFNNLDLAPMWEHLSYKSVDEIKALLTELPYGKVTWWIKSISIYLVITNVAPKKYLIYYLDIIPAIRFLISH